MMKAVGNINKKTPKEKLENLKRELTKLQYDLDSFDNSDLLMLQIYKVETALFEIKSLYL